VQGTGFNWKTPDHFRVVFLPNADDLTDAIGRIARFLESYRKKHGTNAIESVDKNNVVELSKSA